MVGGNMSKALAQLRRARDAYLQDYNNEVIKYAAIGEPLPTTLANYLQELRELPETAVIVEDENGNLDEGQVVWPTKPGEYYE